MCVLFDAGWFLRHPSSWKKASAGVCCSFSCAGDLAEVIEQLSRDTVCPPGVVLPCTVMVWGLRGVVRCPSSSSIYVFFFGET